jgi:hypothetical protein
MEQEQLIGEWIARRIFTTTGLTPQPNQERPGDLPPFRYVGGSTQTDRCESTDEGAFQADGRGLDIAFIGTGVPQDDTQPLQHMDLYPIARDTGIDPTGHDRLNFSMLRQWLPAAHFHVFALHSFGSKEKGLGVSDRHIDEALERCRALAKLDFIIASVTPSHHRFLGSIQIAGSEPHAEPVVSFWPTGNWIPGNPESSKSSIGSVDRNVIVCGQVGLVRLLGCSLGLYRVPHEARYDSEHTLPHFWAPGIRSGPGTAGSSYSTVPVALAWIKMAQVLKFLARHRIMDKPPADLTDFIRSHLRRGRTDKRRIIAWKRDHFPKATKGLINLPAALLQALVEELGPRHARPILTTLFRSQSLPSVKTPRLKQAAAAKRTTSKRPPATPARPYRNRPGLSLGLAVVGALAGYIFHIDLWVHYAPALDQIYFDGWTLIMAISEPGWVVRQKAWSAAGLATSGLLLGILAGFIRRR